MKTEDKFLRFLGFHSPKIVTVIMIFQTIMFFQYFWNHKVYECGFLGLAICIESIMWYWVTRND